MPAPVLLPLAAFLVACTSEPADSPAADPAATTPAPVVQSDPLTDARKLLAAGKASEALKAAEALIAAHPETDEAWDLVEIAALRAGAAGELVDRLSADQAIGGRVERHHLLRGLMALEANRLGDALNAARALQSVAPGDAAALVAHAVQRGAPPPADADPAVAALLKWMADAAPAPADAAVEALPGWRVALLRGETKLARGDRPGAYAEAGKSEAAGAGAIARAAALRVVSAPTPDDAVNAADAGVRAALTAGDAHGAAEILEASLPHLCGNWRAEALATLAANSRKSAAQAKDEAGAARIAAAEALAALHAGRPLAAREAATLSAASPTTKAAGTWLLALSAAALGDAPAVAAAADQLGEPQATAARDLARTLAGEDPALPSSGLKGDDAALQVIFASGWLDDAAPALATASTTATTADVRLWAEALRSRGALAAPPEAPAPWHAEAHARALLTGKATGPLADTSHPAAVHWNAALSGDPGTPGTAGVSAWPRARAALVAGDSATAAREYGTLALAVPAWRSGPWTPLLVLDGPVPKDLVEDSARVAKSQDPLPVAVAMHGWSHRRDATEALWHHGATPFPAAATPEQRAAVWDAVAHLHASQLAWLGGGGTYPTTAVEALEAAEQAAGLQKFQSPTLTALRGALEAAAVISLRQVGGGWELLYITPNGGKLASLKPGFTGTVESWVASVEAGDTAVQSGDRIRAQVIDGANDLLLGIGRYLVVGPAPLGTVPIPALPEQIDGLRYLAEIRHVAHFSDFDALVLPPQSQQDEFQLTLLALSASPGESESIRRTFPGATVLEGKDATVAAWKEKAGQARFVHLGDFDTAPGGGWKLADGVLSLADVASTPLAAHNGYFGGTADAGTRMARIAAIRRTGMQDAVVTGFWQDPTMHDRVVLHYWEGVNRRYTASRSFAEARALSIKEAGVSGKVPVNWAGYFVAGKP